jgi:prevent-host-death family protein
MEPTRIGIRQLRQGLSAAIRRVRNGETLEVTDHGHPVAWIVPVEPTREGLDRLAATGLVEAPTRRSRPEPLDVVSTMTAEQAIDVLRGE